MLNENFNVGFEIGYRYTFSDYLDDVGGNYAITDALQGVATVVADRRFERDAARVNTDRYAIAQQLFNENSGPFQTPVRGVAGLLQDGYLLTNVSIQYIIPGKIKCPPVK